MYLCLALALFRNWLEIRWAVGAVFAADAAYSLALPAVAPVLFLLWAPLRDLWILLSFWLAVHLLGLSSVGRRTGTQHARAHFDAAGFTARLIGLALKEQSFPNELCGQLRSQAPQSRRWLEVVRMQHAAFLQ